jgi:hypothetical protein
LNPAGASPDGGAYVVPPVGYFGANTPPCGDAPSPSTCPRYWCAVGSSYRRTIAFPFHFLSPPVSDGGCSIFLIDDLNSSSSRDPPRPGERALAVLGLPRADGGVPLVEDAVRPPPRDEVHLHARVFRIVTRVALPPVQLGRRQRLLFVLRRVRQRGELLARLLDALRRRRPSLSLRRSRHGAAEPRVLQGRSIQAKVGVEFIGVSWR